MPPSHLWLPSASLAERSPMCRWAALLPPVSQAELLVLQTDPHTVISRLTNKTFKPVEEVNKAAFICRTLVLHINLLRFLSEKL